MLADRTGKPLIQHVWERAKLAKRIDRVIVATDDQRIFDAVKRFGGEALMTRADHANGTSRIAEVVFALNLQSAKAIVNVQGDEPDADPDMIDCAVEALVSAPSECVVATVAVPYPCDEDPQNPNLVKVVVENGRAVSFSRTVPEDRRGPLLRHVGIYVYRPAFLLEYVRLSPTAGETRERLEQLRMMEHGYAIAVHVARDETWATSLQSGIDTPQQYEAFVKRTRAIARTPTD